MCAAVVIYIFSAQCVCYLDISADYIKADDGDKCAHEPARLQMGAFIQDRGGVTLPRHQPVLSPCFFVFTRHYMLQTLAVEVLPSDLSLGVLPGIDL